MTPVLPIELQLHILELSVPLYTRRNFPEVRKLALTLPLVCRAWSSTAYRLLSPIAKIVYEAKEGEADATKLRVDALLACRSVEALDLTLTQWDQIDGWPDTLPSWLPRVRRLWVSLPPNGAEWRVHRYPGVSRYLLNLAWQGLTSAHRARIRAPYGFARVESAHRHLAGLA